jgi:hypothetical protein
MSRFDIISSRRTNRLIRAGIVRPDISGSKLRDYQRQGYAKVAFVANVTADPECAALNGQVYMIDDLLRLDNPLYRTSHPNCNCSFAPVPEDFQQ